MKIRLYCTAVPGKVAASSVFISPIRLLPPCCLSRLQRATTTGCGETGARPPPARGPAGEESRIARANVTTECKSFSFTLRCVTSAPQCIFLSTAKRQALRRCSLTPVFLCECASTCFRFCRCVGTSVLWVCAVFCRYAQTPVSLWECASTFFFVSALGRLSFLSVHRPLCPHGSAQAPGFVFVGAV